jgi:hypothetical protein
MQFDIFTHYDKTILIVNVMGSSSFLSIDMGITNGSSK